MLSSITPPYGSLNELYKTEETVQFIWNASRLRAKIFGIDEEITSKKFYKFYNKKTRPCPFIVQQLTSHIPLAVISLMSKKNHNVNINGLEHTIDLGDCDKPLSNKPQTLQTVVPRKATEWTLITIQGPKTIDGILEYFRIEEGIEITRIKWENGVIYTQNTKNVGRTIEEVTGSKAKVIELILEGLDKDKQNCLISRTKYTIP